MKSKVIIAMVVLTLLSAGVGSSCGGGGGGGLVDLVEMVPKESTAFVFWDVETLGTDFYTVWQEWKGEEADWLSDLGGIRAGEVEFFARAATPALGNVTIVTGDFILKDIEENLKDTGYDGDSYLGVPRLTKTEGGKEIAVALYNRSVVVGGKELVEKCIEVYKGKEGSYSLYKDPSIKGIVDRLPVGVMAGIEKNVVLYDDLAALGMSVEKKDENTLRVNAVYKFDVPGAAKDEDTLANIKNDLTTIDLTVMKGECFEPEAEAKGEFVEGTTSMYVDDFSYFDLAE